MSWQWITEEIGYLPATQEPLSADVGLIHTKNRVWLFDVGCTDDMMRQIEAIAEEKWVVLSHFHPDHIGNLDHMQYDALYGGAFTCKKIGKGTVVAGDLYLEDKVHLFSIPSAHAKGCVGLEYGGYAFLGDALYPAQKASGLVYNVSLLAQQIKVLEKLQAEQFFISHKVPALRSKTAVLTWLKKVYSKRIPGQTYLPW